ncbi:MAG: amidohydrolase family protein [Candidatus Krumholzibacteria bacterium]|nr:amidohydrolase family protein [Candidatus Krumholzibacteria bacterium]
MLIQGGQILTATGPTPADVLVQDGLITAVGTGLKPEGDLVDATGRWIMPGAVDVHTHFGMPLDKGLGNGLNSLSWADSSAAAVLGGTTTVIDFANPSVGEPLAAAVARWRALGDGHTLCDYGLHVTVTDTSAERLAEIPALLAEGLPTFKGFLAYKGRLMLTSTQMKTLMSAVRAAGGRLLVHAEDGEMNAEAQDVLLNVGRTGANYHPLAHPAESEIKAVDEVLAMANDTGCPLTVVHMSLEASVELLRAARRVPNPAPLNGEVCLHHLFADESLYDAGHEAALGAICSPPLRPAANGPKLLAALAAGDLDFLSTDHCEFCLRDKAAAAAGGFHEVPNGCGGVGERLVLSHSLAVVPGNLSLERWQDVICARPADLMGLHGRKGRLAPGYDADVVLFDPTPEYRWEPLGPSDRAGSIWAGTPVQGQVTDVWLRGSRVVNGARLVPDQPGGMFLPRQF